MAIVSVQVTIGAGTTQISSTSIQARWIAFSNNAAAAMRIGDKSTSSTRGIALPTSGLFTAPAYANAGYGCDLSQWFVSGTATQILDVVYDEVD